MRGHVRLLPLAMGGMAVLAVLKVVGIGSALMAPATVPGQGPARGGGLVTAAVASESKPAKPAAPVPAPVAAAPGPEPAAVAGPSEAEKSLLQDLRARREKLDAQGSALEGREVLVKAAERALQDRLEQLAAVQARLEALEKTRSEREEANWRGLVKTYEAMRPKDAAAIFNDLDPAILVEVLDRMKEAKAAPVLAAMQPERARAATAQLAQWRQRTTGGARG